MYVHMQDCTEHFRYQITNKHNHVGYVLESTKTSDASILVSMENIGENTATTGKCNRLESDVTYISPRCPVAKRHNNYKKHNQFQISDTSAKGQGFGSKVAIGNIIVHFRYHTNHEHNHKTPD